MKVTPQDVTVALDARGDCTIFCHKCILCGYPCGYVHHNGFLWYDHGCDCTGRNERSPTTPDDLAEWVNIQTSEAHAHDIWQRIARSGPVVTKEISQ